MHGSEPPRDGFATKCRDSILGLMDSIPYEAAGGGVCTIPRTATPRRISVYKNRGLHNPSLTMNLLYGCPELGRVPEGVTSLGQAAAVSPDIGK